MKHREPIKLDIERHPLGKAVMSIRNSDLKSEEIELSRKVTINDCRYVASYNWLDEPTPTIIIPGKQFKKVRLRT